MQPVMRHSFVSFPRNAKPKVRASFHAANYVHGRYIFIAQNLQKKFFSNPHLTTLFPPVCPLSFYKGNSVIFVIFGYRIAGCIVRTSNVSIISVTCNITLSHDTKSKTILSNDVKDKFKKIIYPL